MANTPCIIKNITLVEITNGARYTGPIDMDGIQREPSQGEATTEEDCRFYFCNNCLKKFDGEETFDICKAHLGTFPIDE